MKLKIILKKIENGVNIYKGRVHSQQSWISCLSLTEVLFLSLFEGFSLSFFLKNTRYFQNRETSVHDEGAELYKTFFKNMPGRILRPPAGLQCDKESGLCFLCLLQVWLLFASINSLISKIERRQCILTTLKNSNI